MSASEQRCKDTYAEFQKADMVEKRSFVTKLVAELKEGNEVLETIHSYLVSWAEIPLSELEEIVRAVIMSNLELGEEKRSAGIQALEQAKARIVNMRQKEEEEKIAEQENSLEALAWFV